MLHDNDVRVHFAGLGLGLHQGQKGIRGQDKIGNAAFFKFDAVMETPRRTCPSIRYSEDRSPVFAGQFVVHPLSCGLCRAVLKGVINIVGIAVGAHLVA